MTFACMAAQASPFPVEAFSRLAAIESTHWWFRGRNQLLLWIMREKVRPKTDFLEVGCGTGCVLEAVALSFPWLKLEATEFHEEGIGYARIRTPTCRFRQLDATLMSDISRYDCIGCFDVLEHIQSDETVLQNFHVALRSRGYLILTVPQHRWLWSVSDDFAEHVRRYSRKEIVAKLKSAGFRVSYLSSFVSLLLPLMIAQRLGASHGKQDDYSIDQLLSINPFLNHCFYMIMLVELWLLRHGLTFLAGGSLIILAQKP